MKQLAPSQLPGRSASSQMPVPPVTPSQLPVEDPIAAPHAANGDDRGYFGAKSGSGVAERIICEIPPHLTFIEAFAGSAAVTRRKLPCRSAIVIDSEAAACNKLRRIPGLTVVCDDALAWLGHFLLTRSVDGAASDAVLYLDPPYLFEARATGKRQRYAHEFGEEWQHVELLDCLRRLATAGVPVLISHPRHPLYEQKLLDPSTFAAVTVGLPWRVIDYRYGTRGGPFADALWCSFPSPTSLHDYRFVGADYRQRELIKRKVKRWQSKFQALPPVQQRIIFDALADLLPPEVAMTAERVDPR